MDRCSSFFLTALLSWWLGALRRPVSWPLAVVAERGVGTQHPEVVRLVAYLVAVEATFDPRCSKSSRWRSLRCRSRSLPSIPPRCLRLRLRWRPCWCPGPWTPPWSPRRHALVDFGHVGQCLPDCLCRAAGHLRPSRLVRRSRHRSAV